MSIEDKVAQAEKLIAEVKAELAEKASKARNWPEKIEAGMCFGLGSGEKFILLGNSLVRIETGGIWATGRDPFGGDQAAFEHLGKLDLTIRTDAHEPTREDLVGQWCQYADCEDGWTVAAFKCESYDPSHSLPYRVGVGGSAYVHYRHARLAR